MEIGEERRTSRRKQQQAIGLFGVMPMVIALLAHSALADVITIHVDSKAALHGGGTGDAAKPFKSLEQAKQHIIDNKRFAASVFTVLIHPGTYAPLALDHPKLSGSLWAGAVPAEPPVVSGGVHIPMERFQPWSGHSKAWVASVAGLTAESEFGSMISGNEVVDCQHDKVGLSSGGRMLTLARWPNTNPTNVSSPWRWARARNSAQMHSSFLVDPSETPDATRVLKWADEPDGWIHGYLQFDWADCYGKIKRVSKADDEMVRLDYDYVPDAHDGARWYGVNLLCELDAPGEFYIDADKALVYIIPLDASGSRTLGAPPADVSLMYQPGGVLNVTSSAVNVTIRDMVVRDGRHAGILAKGALGLTVERVVVSSHGTDGIVLTGARDSAVRASEVHDVGCAGVRATGGIAATLEKGNIVIAGNHVHHYAQWKRTYQPGVYWGGVGNVYSNNTVQHAPHNGFLGGGDFEDAVNNLFENNTLTDLTYETIDSGAFYSSGQRGSAFTNRGNVLRGSTIMRVRNTAGTGFQTASNQGVYLDDQASAWLVEGNHFIDCQVGSFIGGGRENRIIANRYVRCGTVQYLNDQGRGFDSHTVDCDTVAPPFKTDCSTGAADWMTSQSPAAATWAARWPQMTRLHEPSAHLGWPANGEITNNSYCVGGATPGEFISSNVPVDVRRDLAKWYIMAHGNVETHDC